MAGAVLSASVAALSIGALSYAHLNTAVEVDPAVLTVAKTGKTMPAFKSADELTAQLKKLREKRLRESQSNAASNMQLDGVSTNAAAGAPSMMKLEASKSADKDEDSITNTQHAGVDEGGIVKVHGDHLVILRRGRLFTVKVGDNALKPVSSVDAYPPGINPSSDWYDEMLVSGNTIVVVGYSYGRGGTEINLFDITERGLLAYRSTYHLRSNDYYSSRNYASRLIGNKLIFYTPQYLGYSDNPMQQFPAYRKWHTGAKDNEFKPVVSATRVYRPSVPDENISTSALHTVTVCDLGTREMTCDGTAVLGAPGRVFYVSPRSVYIWTTEWNYHNGGSNEASMLYKMPLDGSAPSALGVAGSPVDQFSFLESDGEQLNVLVRSNGRGEQMWGSEYALGDVSLFRVDADSFADGSENASVENYRSLPKPDGYTFQNRFVGDYLLYGSGNGWGRQKNKEPSNLFAVNWKTAAVTYLNVLHSVDRIEPLGNAAVVVGINGSDLYFSPIKLGKRPNVKDPYVRKNASQGELRSHGFFYKPDDDNNGLLGLPIAREGRRGYRHLVEGSAAILFIKNDGLNFDQVGELEARNTSMNDGCRASCVDWYGNARPIFLRGRIFALLGYELVEGRLDDGQLIESRRVNYSPKNYMSYRIENDE